MRIRKAEPRDLARIVQIEGLCFPEETAFPPGMFVYLIRYAVALVACEPEEKILGFVMGYTSGTLGAVYTLDVHPGYRRKGIGSELIRALEKKLAKIGCKSRPPGGGAGKTRCAGALPKSRLPGERAGQELLRAGKSCGANVEKIGVGRFATPWMIRHRHFLWLAGSLRQLRTYERSPRGTERTENSRRLLFIQLPTRSQYKPKR